MSVSQQQIDLILAQARVREMQGYFEKARSGDQRAASLFARLIAYDVNPTGTGSEVGCLSKTLGETNVDGFAEDAVCCNNAPSDLQNVLDLVNGTGAPNASIPSRVLVSDLKQRRVENLWVKPQPLSAADMGYLLSGGPPPLPPQPPVPTFPYPDENTAVKAYQARVKASYNAVGRKFPDEQDSDAFRHFTRYGYDCDKMPEPDSANKHIKELRRELGAPPE